MAHEFDAELVRRYDRPGPRYTSYPTAVQFHAGFDAARYEEAARRSNAVETQPLSLYVHVPFCENPCFYCGCTKVITRDHSVTQRYLAHLFLEIERQGALFAANRPIDQLHFGGGTPTFLSDREILDVLEHLARHFSIHARPDREYSIEIDPRTVTVERLRTLVEMGFNRISIGVQDFDPVVQRAVNRVQDEEHVLSLIAHARELSDSISLDLIYGLPKQTIGTYSRTLDAVIAARPDRIAAYSYAHLPQLFKPQKQIKEHDLLTAAAKLELLALNIEKLTAAGYVYVGMDHFALPTDELVRAQRSGTLQRNFQGYSTRADCDLVGLGLSAISKVGDVYAQNARTLAEYYRLIDLGSLAIQRGIQINNDDRIRRQVIQHLMCSTRIDFVQFDTAYGILFENYFSRELIALEPLIDDGLVVRGGRSIELTARGRLLLRNVAMVFDAYLPANSDVAFPMSYSRAV